MPLGRKEAEQTRVRREELSPGCGEEVGCKASMRMVPIHTVSRNELRFDNGWTSEGGTHS
jgi:hypothetical protein